MEVQFHNFTTLGHHPPTLVSTVGKLILLLQRGAVDGVPNSYQHQTNAYVKTTESDKISSHDTWLKILDWKFSNTSDVNKAPRNLELAMIHNDLDNKMKVEVCKPLGVAGGRRGKRVIDQFFPSCRISTECFTAILHKGGYSRIIMQSWVRNTESIEYSKGNICRTELPARKLIKNGINPLSANWTYTSS